MPESIDSDDLRPSKRSRQNVSQACVNCRQRYVLVVGWATLAPPLEFRRLRVWISRSSNANAVC